MKKLILNFIFILLSVNSLWGHEFTIADSFQYPISDNDLYQNSNSNPKKGWTMIQDFQDCREEVIPEGINPPCRHLGEDLFYYDNGWNSANKEVFAVANGYVVASGVRKGFAGYIILKHYLSNDLDNYVLSIYGHLTTQDLPIKGAYFKKGQTLSTLATYYVLNKYIISDPHLHFEIRKSKNITGLSDTTLNDGYDDNNGRYYDPTDIYFWGTNSDENNEEGFIENYKPINNSSSATSSIDGAGSLIRPEIFSTTDRYKCQWGCYRDEADMQVHSIPSTVSFQWKATEKCKKLKIGVKANEAYIKKYHKWIHPNKALKVKIYRKKWSDDVVTEAFKTTLPKTVDYVDGWNNIIITSQEPLSKVQEIIAECTEEDDGKDVTMLDDETSIDLPLNYKYGGQSSIIRGSNSTYNDQQDGIYQDMAIGLSDNKAMTLFQWQTSSNCDSLLLKSGTYTDGYSATLNGVSMKGWAEKSWTDNQCKKKLPCTLKNPSTDGKSHFYIIKVKTKANALYANRISAVCTQ